jgi:nucleoside-diphosphate-sugar epimerase
MERKIALVTGSSGFIGSNLCRRLAGEGWHVRALVRKTSSREFLEGVDAEHCIGSIDDLPSLQAASKDVHTVFHLAARPPDWGKLEVFRKDNVEGTRNVIEAAAGAGAQRFFHMSSLSAHNFTGHLDADEDTPFMKESELYGASFHYNVSKAEAEVMAFELARDKGLALSAARTGMAYGPNDHGIFFQMAEGVRSGMYSHVGGGKTIMSLAYVDNLLDGIMAAATHPQAVGRVYNLVDDGKVSIRAFVDAMCDALGWKRPKSSVPLGVAKFAGAALEDLYRLVGARRGPPLTRYRIAYVAKDLHFSNARAKNELGWAPKIGLEEGLRRTAEWYLRYTKQAPAGASLTAAAPSG